MPNTKANIELTLYKIFAGGLINEDVYNDLLQEKLVEKGRFTDICPPTCGRISARITEKAHKLIIEKLSS